MKEKESGEETDSERMIATPPGDEVLISLLSRLENPRKSCIDEKPRPRETRITGNKVYEDRRPLCTSVLVRHK